MIRLQNYYEHPSQRSFMVYEFAKEEAGIYFEQMLINANIPYEKGTEERRGINYHLFGVHKKHKISVEKINTDTLIKHKTSFLPDRGLQWFTFAFTLAILALAIIGYLKSTA